MPVKTRRSGTARLLFATAGLAVASPFLVAATPASDWTTVRDTFDDCTGTDASPTEVVLSADVDADGAVLEIDCVATLDLSGHLLDTGGVLVTPGNHLTIDDSAGGGQLVAARSAEDSSSAGIETTSAKLTIDGGHITATANAAGIGGGKFLSSGTIVINGGTIYSTGKDSGIGGGLNADGGTTTINGGTIHATGNQAGIGGGFVGDGGDITINGGTVHANGAGAGIGGGFGGDGGNISINDGAVFATSRGAGAGIGGGDNQDGGTITINGGVITAKGSYGAAIGGGSIGDGGTISVNGGTVLAENDNYGAGIGGGHLGGNGGTTIINGGDVTAVSERGAGIGGGYGGSGGTTTINGGSVSAQGGLDAAGIGAGMDGDGPTLTITGGTTTATGHFTAIGGSWMGEFGSADLTGGTLRLPSGRIVVPDTLAGPEILIGEGAAILGTIGDPTQGALVLGNGQIENGGVIALSATQVLSSAVDVHDRNHLVTFDSDGGTPATTDIRVFGPDFASSYRSLPSDPTRGADPFLGWTLTDDPMVPFTTDTPLPGGSSGPAIEIDVTARWGPASVDTGLVDDAVSTEAGEPVTFTPTLLDGEGEALPSDPATWQITDADGLVETTIDPDTGEITVGSETAGVHELTLTVPTRAGAVDVTITVDVAAAAPAELTLLPSDDTVMEGDTITIDVTGTDEYGNDTGDESGEVTLTSDVETDEIDGTAVTFPTASPHTITATHDNGTTAAITIEVTPSPSTTVTTTTTTTVTPRAIATPRATTRGALPKTGSDSIQPMLTVAGCAIALGTLLTAAHRRQTSYRPRHLRGS